MDIPQALAIWLHTVAFVIAWGYYGVLGRIVLPALSASPDRRTAAATLVAIERRALPLVGLSLVLFIATGAWLLLTSAHYAGLGNFFASTWTLLMLAKHVLVVVLLVVGLVVDRLIRSAGRAVSDEAREAAFRMLRWSAEGATALGALIVLLTALAQVAS